MRSPIRVLSLCAALLAPATALHAECRRDTLPNRPPQMAFFSQFAAFHVDLARGRAQFNGKGTAAFAGRFAAAWCGLPALTIAYVAQEYGLRDGLGETGFVSLDSAGLRPPLHANLNGLELQVRWPDARRVHLIESASTGAAETQYEFWRPRLNYLGNPVGGDHIVEGRSSTRYAEASIGVELALVRLLRVYSLVGVRRTGRITTPELSAFPFNGSFAMVTLGFGKFK